MPRKKAAPKREILPDPLFKSKVVSKFISVIMRGGKKSVAERIVYGSLNIVVSNSLGRSADIHKDEDNGEGGSREAALTLFKKALKNVTPIVEVKSRRIGGATYQVPSEIPSSRRQTLAMRLLAEAARKRSEGTMTLKLAAEIMDACAEPPRGGAVKKREEMHRMAKANQSFAHHQMA
jgi:small subunit ribosomal protein S7